MTGHLRAPRPDIQVKMLLEQKSLVIEGNESYVGEESREGLQVTTGNVLLLNLGW